MIVVYNLFVCCFVFHSVHGQFGSDPVHEGFRLQHKNASHTVSELQVTLYVCVHMVVIADKHVVDSDLLRRRGKSS